MAKRIEKLNEKQLHKMISEAISEIADSNGYYEVLHYLHDIAGSEEGERIINGLYGDSAMEYENAIEELKSMFPTVRPNSLEAAIRSFERESNGNDRFVAESKKQVKLNEKQLRNMIAKSVKSVLNEEFGVAPEMHPSYEAMIRARNLVLDFDYLIKTVKKIPSQKYEKILNDLKVGYSALSELAYPSNTGGNEGRGFGTDGSRAF